MCWLQVLCLALQEKWQGTHIAMAHRTGTVKVCEASVIIAVSSPHRQAAIEVSRMHLAWLELAAASMQLLHWLSMQPSLLLKLLWPCGRWTIFRMAIPSHCHAPSQATVSWSTQAPCSSIASCVCTTCMRLAVAGEVGS
jgi:hypothetical protein